MFVLWGLPGMALSHLRRIQPIASDVLPSTSMSRYTARDTNVVLSACLQHAWRMAFLATVKFLSPFSPFLLPNACAVAVWKAMRFKFWAVARHRTWPHCLGPLVVVLQAGIGPRVAPRTSTGWVPLACFVCSLRMPPGGLVGPGSLRELPPTR